MNIHENLRFVFYDANKPSQRGINAKIEHFGQVVGKLDGSPIYKFLQTDVGAQLWKWAGKFDSHIPEEGCLVDLQSMGCYVPSVADI